MPTDEHKLFSEFPPVSREQWEEVIKKDLRGADYKTTLEWHTGEGIDVLPFYREEDLDEPPAPISFDKNDWEIRQPISEQDISNANKIALHVLENGADALEFTIKIDHTKENSDNLQGVNIQDQEAFDKLLDGINPEKTPLYFNTKLYSPILLAMFYNNCQTKNWDSSKISGSLLFDPYALFITTGLFPKDETAFIDQSRQMVDFCHKNLPKIKCLGVDAGVYHHAGATIVQEIGYALATGGEYLATLSDAGLDTDIIAQSIHFNFAVGSNYFLEIAKFRAVRKLWRIILGEYGVSEEMPTYLQGSSSEWNKTMYDPYVNMLRATTEGMAAAIAGCDAITIHPFDKTFRQPDDFSRRIARNSQIIAKEESHLDEVADPSAGSYYIETLTDKIAEAAWNCFQEVENQDGMLKSIRSGYPQTAIEESREQRNQAIARRKRVFVGTNEYPNPNEDLADQRLEEPPEKLLQKNSENAAIDPSQLMSTLGEALKDGCALGDLVPALFDLHREDIRPIRPYRGAQAFEELRQATENHSTTPTVLTLPIGNKKMRKARSAFAVNLFGCVGYDITDPIGFDSVDEAMNEIKNNRPDIVVLCSSDEEYEQLVPELSKKLNQLDRKSITVLAGYPKEQVEQYLNAGIDEFIHAKSDALKTLKNFQQKLGIIKN